jgi:aminoglycoside phosphotransferase (APT) family kinase protein
LSNLKSMAKPSLILAALAADALPGLRFVQVQNLTREGVPITVELLTTAQGRLIMLKSPLNSAANTALGTEVRALQVLKSLTLPFSISTFLGKTSAKAIRNALAFEYVPGLAIDLGRVRADDVLLSSVGKAISTIHSIPSSVLGNSGLPEYEPAQRVRERVAEFDRAMDTGKIHPDLLERWQNALFEVNLFKYQPTVVHGSLKSEFLLAEGSHVSGITEWGQLSVDDPAIDLAFIYGEAQPEIAAAIMLAYEATTRADKNLRQRAHLYYELSFATYLLEAVERADEEEIESALGLLADLHAELLAGSLPSLKPTDFTSSPAEVIVPISHAASFTAPVAIVTESIEVIDLAEASPEPLEQEQPKAKPEDELF